VFALDEGWVLTKSEDGGVLGDQMIRYARKNNATVILGSQNVVDLGALRDLISTYFIFGVTNAKEAARALDLVGLDPDDETLQNKISARSFEKGMCLIRMDDRVDVVKVDMPQTDLDVLRTEPARGGRRSPRDSPRDPRGRSRRPGGQRLWRRGRRLLTATTTRPEHGRRRVREGRVRMRQRRRGAPVRLVVVTEPRPSAFVVRRLSARARLPPDPAAGPAAHPYLAARRPGAGHRRRPIPARRQPPVPGCLPAP
jgi:hypothetical protein